MRLVFCCFLLSDAKIIWFRICFLIVACFLLHKMSIISYFVLQKAAHHGDYCSEYGFKQPNNKLDDTLSTVATESLANQSAVSAAAPTATLRKGLLWQQRDKLFSRWKERFFILTADYLQCFKKASSAGSISEMGGFIFKLRLSEIEEVELLDRKGYLTISVTLTREGSSKVLLRKPEGIRDWFHTLKTCVERCKERKGLMKTTKEFWSKKQFTDSSSMEQWILARRRIEAKYSYNNEETAADSHPMREMSKSNLNLNEKILTTTDYGFIDFPGASEVKSDFGDGESRASLSPIAQTKIVKDSSSTFSHDSGVDSMNTNSSGEIIQYKWVNWYLICKIIRRKRHVQTNAGESKRQRPVKS